MLKEALLAGGYNWETVSALVAYSACSSLMLIINKMAVSSIRSPSFVTLFQLFTCVGFVFGLYFVSPSKADRVEWVKVKPYLVYIASFSAGIYTNMKALEVSNVDTIIVFRCCTPLVVAMLDFLFLGRELPNARSAASLVVLLLSASGYVMFDSAFRLDGVAAYFWVIIYFFLLCFSMTYGKLVTDAVPMKTMWGAALYSNLLSIPPTFLFGLVAGEYSVLHNIRWTVPAVVYLILSCVIGVGISYTGWAARKTVSATTYTLVGVMNKMVTVAINVLIWDQHASAVGLFFLVVCIMAGSMYQQSPLRDKESAASYKSQAPVRV